MYGKDTVIAVLPVGESHQVKRAPRPHAFLSDLGILEGAAGVACALDITPERAQELIDAHLFDPAMLRPGCAPYFGEKNVLKIWKSFLDARKIMEGRV